MLLSDGNNMSICLGFIHSEYCQAILSLDAVLISRFIWILVEVLKPYNIHFHHPKNQSSAKKLKLFHVCVFWQTHWGDHQAIAKAAALAGWEFLTLGWRADWMLPLLYDGCPVSCLPSLSCTLIHSPEAGVRVTGNVKSPDRMLPDSLRSARLKLSLPSASESNSARLCSAQRAAEFAADAKPKSILPPPTYHSYMSSCLLFLSPNLCSQKEALFCC